MSETTGGNGCKKVRFESFADDFLDIQAHLTRIQLGFAAFAGYNQPTRARMKSMTKQEAREFKDRWKFVNDYIGREIRNTPGEIKLQQLSAMFITGQSRSPASLAEEQKVRNRWLLLKQKANV